MKIFPLPLFAAGLLASACAFAADRPNIVYMLSDDQSWYGLSVPMHPDLSNADPLNDPDNPLDVIGMSERALDFMRRADEAGKPFFVHISYYPLHRQFNAAPETKSRAEARPDGRIHSDVDLAAVTENLDMGVGVVMDGLDRLGLSDNTYLIYMGDNGHRPGDNNVRTNETDNPAPLFGAKGNVQRPVPELVFHFPHYQAGTPQSAIRAGDYKLIKYWETGETVLFDLSTDIGERHNLALRQPEKARALEVRLDEYLESVDADMLVVNPDYDPTKESWVGSRNYDLTVDPMLIYYPESFWSPRR